MGSGQQAFSAVYNRLGLFSAVLPRRRRFTVELPVLGLILIALCGLLLFGLATARVGVLAVVAAVVPVGIAITALLWVDWWEPEIANLVVVTFLWLACGPSLRAVF